MNPLDEGQYRPAQGADEVRVKAQASETGNRESVVGGGESNSVNQAGNGGPSDGQGLSRPPSHKKRARRRYRGKNAHSPTELQLASGDQPSNDNLASSVKSHVTKRRRKRRKSVLANLPEPQNGYHPHDHDQLNGCVDGKSKAPREKKETRHHDSASHYDAPLYAALDLGTNNCRLLIATPTRPGHFRVVDAFSRIVRLGEGLGKTGRLSDDAMDRAVEALKICAQKLAQKKIKHQRLIATEACRSAANGEMFIRRVRDETGLELEIVDRETEARLAVSGCGTLVEHETDAIVLFDIGGGSSEIALIDVSQQRSPRLAEHIIAWTSLQVGVVTLAERFGGDLVSLDDFYKMKAYVASLLAGFTERDKLGSLTQGPHFHLLGTSGTVTTLAGLYLDLDRYDRRRVDGIWMDAQDVTKMTERLLSWDLSARVANPCIGRDRADLVLAGCAILEAIREVWPSERLRVADRGLREGILTELMSKDGAWRRRRRQNSKRRYHREHQQVKPA